MSRDGAESSSLAYWNRIARKYAGRPVRDQAAYEETLADVAKRLTTADHVLELGCGTGTTAIRLAPIVASWKATDISPRMIEIARAKPAPSNVHFEVATSDEALASGEYQTICAFHFLHLVSEPEHTLESIHRALTPKGILISKTFCFGDLNFAVRLLVSMLQFAGIVPPAKSLKSEELRRMIRDAGFGIEAEKAFGRVQSIRYIVASRSKPPAASTS